MLKAFADVDLETHVKDRLLELIVMPSKESVDVQPLLEHAKCPKPVIIPKEFANVARILHVPISRMEAIATR